MSKVGLHIATFYWPFNTFSQLKPLKTNGNCRHHCMLPLNSLCKMIEGLKKQIRICIVELCSPLSKEV